MLNMIHETLLEYANMDNNINKKIDEYQKEEKKRI